MLLIRLRGIRCSLAIPHFPENLLDKRPSFIVLFSSYLRRLSGADEQMMEDRLLKVKDRVFPEISGVLLSSLMGSWVDEECKRDSFGSICFLSNG